MKKKLLMIVFLLTLFLSQNTVKGNDVPDDVLGEVTGIQDTEEVIEYDQDLTITYTEESATLNGEPFVSGTTISEIGNYELVLFEAGLEVNRIEFVINARFTHDIEDVVSYDDVFIELENDGTILVEETEVENGHTLTYLGEYDITIVGVNEYSKTYTVTILDQKIEYLKDHPVYDDFTIDISLFKEVYYENELVEEDITFTEIGYYSLYVVYGDDSEDTLQFTYAHSTNRFENNGVYQNSLLIQKDSAQKWYIDSVEQKQGIDSLFITKVGQHSVVFSGKNGYEKRYIVTVTEGDIGIEDGDVYLSFFTHTFKNYKVTLNNSVYVSGTKKYGGGNYLMQIKGTGGYVSEYNIFIKEPVPFEEQDPFDDPLLLEESMTLNQNFRKIFVNGEEVENFRFSESGVYRIVYVGAGDYLEAYTVEFVNQHEDVNQTLFQGVMGLGALLIITYVFVAWRRFK